MFTLSTFFIRWALLIWWVFLWYWFGNLGDQSAQFVEPSSVAVLLSDSSVVMCHYSGDRTPKHYRHWLALVFLTHRLHQISTSGLRPLRWSSGRSRSVTAPRSRNTTWNGRSGKTRIFCRYVVRLIQALSGACCGFLHHLVERANILIVLLYKST